MKIWSIDFVDTWIPCLDEPCPYALDREIFPWFVWNVDKKTWSTDFLPSEMDVFFLNGFIATPQKNTMQFIILFGEDNFSPLNLRLPPQKNPTQLGIGIGNPTRHAFRTSAYDFFLVYPDVALVGASRTCLTKSWSTTPTRGVRTRGTRCVIFSLHGFLDSFCFLWIFRSARKNGCLAFWESVTLRDVTHIAGC